MLLATANKGKAVEMEAYLKDLPIQIVSLLNLRQVQSFAEKGRTFLENARGKSLFYTQKWSGLCLAEDSGLEVEYLNGAPGVYSARFAGNQATDEQNINKVLSLLKGVAWEKRKARFVSCMVLSQSNHIIHEIQASVKGFIADREKGDFGFGYDPVFYYPPLNKTFAELFPKEKNRVSHRGQALVMLKQFLSNYLA